MASRGGGSRRRGPHNTGAVRGDKTAMNGAARPLIHKSIPHIEGAYKNKHLVHAVTSLIGCIVELRTTGGNVYQGVLNTFSSQGEVVIEMATQCTKEEDDDDVSLNKASLIETLCIPWNDIAIVSSINNNNSKDIFRTDGEIGSRNGVTGSRDLQPFEFDDSTDDGRGHLVESMEGSGWNAEAMFDINKQKFNVSSSFSPEMSGYTTSLSIQDSVEDNQRLLDAEKKAKEIEGSQQFYRNRTEDQGTEEELFSAVVIPNEKKTEPKLEESNNDDDNRNEVESSGIEHKNESIEQTDTIIDESTAQDHQTDSQQQQQEQDQTDAQQQEKQTDETTTENKKTIFKLNPDAIEFKPYTSSITSPPDTPTQDNTSPPTHHVSTQPYSRGPRLKGPRGPRPPFTDQQGLYGGYQPSFQSGIRPMFQAGLTAATQPPAHIPSPANFVLRQPISPLIGAQPGGQTQLYSLTPSIGAHGVPLGQQVYIPASQSAAIFGHHHHQSLSPSLPQSPPVLYLQAPIPSQNYGQSFLTPQQLGGTMPGTSILGYTQNQLGKQ